jgi:hypothetical protein
MKTPYLDTEIQRLSMLESRDELTEWGKEMLNELKEIKETVTNREVEKMYALDEMLDLITTFNLSTSYKTVEEAKYEVPKLFSSKRKCAKEWIEKNELH